MASVWEELALTVHRDRGVVELEAARAWIEGELRTTDREIARYVERYGVTHPDALEHGIASGQIPGHPAWEDRIDWGNLVLYREQLLTMLARLSQADIQS